MKYAPNKALNSFPAVTGTITLRYASHILAQHYCPLALR